MAEVPIEITRGFVPSGAERIYYESAGEGDTVIFCHGLGGNHFGEPAATPVMFKFLQQTSYPHEALKKLIQPVLCLVGSEDRLIPPALLRQAAAILPHAQVVEIPGTGHSPYFEAPEIWNSVVLDFLARVGA